MKFVIGCDVDPILPEVLTRPLSTAIWSSVEHVEVLRREMGAQLPPITWLIRSDASVRFATGDWASGYLSHKKTWQQLAELGHELGWHMHLLSWNEKSGAFRFDPRPEWLSEAHGALSKFFQVRATRTGWDYGNDFLMNELDRLGILIDFSAIPGSIAWISVGKDKVISDWRRTLGGSYKPDASDYQRSGGQPLRLIELPIAQFPNSPAGIIKRIVWRAWNGCISLRGLKDRTKMLTERWERLPQLEGEVMALFFHPEELAGEGKKNLIRNLRALTELPGAQFVTASKIAESF